VYNQFSKSKFDFVKSFSRKTAVFVSESWQSIENKTIFFDLAHCNCNFKRNNQEMKLWAGGAFIQQTIFCK